jgi:phosphate uptake regulator
MNSVGDQEGESNKRTASKNIKGLWRDAVQALKTTTTSSSGSTDDETRTVSRMDDECEKEQYLYRSQLIELS